MNKGKPTVTKLDDFLEILRTALDLSPFPPSFWENMYREKVDIYVFTYLFLAKYKKNQDQMHILTMILNSVCPA